MRNTIIIILFFCLGITSICAQKDSISMQAYVSPSGVELRTSVYEADILDVLKSEGFRLVRYTRAAAGVELDDSTSTATLSEIAPIVKPLSAAAWKAKDFSDDSLALSGYALLYEDLTPIGFKVKSIKDAVELHNTRKNKVSFTNIVANFDKEIAEAMGLYSIDTQISMGDTYEYQLLKKSDGKRLASHIVTCQPTPSDTLYIQHAIGGDSIVRLSWNNSDQYFAYNIYESTDSLGSYQKVNSLPYVYAIDNGEEKVNLIRYTNQLKDNEHTYYYKIGGIDYFGVERNQSVPIAVKGIPAKLDIDVVLKINHVTESSVHMSLSGIDDEAASKITSIKMYKSDKQDGQYDFFKNIQQSEISSPIVDSSPHHASYYIVTAIDQNDHAYKSNIVLAQPIDSIPPAKPTSFTATVVDGTVRLSWKAGTETDLDGYKVYRANFRNEVYTDRSRYILSENKYDDIVDTKSLMDSLFYKVVAYDKNGNQSEYSDVLGIPRPSTVPPSQPILYNARPSSAGVLIKWGLSEDSDIAYNVLLRKPLNRKGWDEVIKIMPGDSVSTQQFGTGIDAYHYIDATKLDPMIYEYRIMAYSSSGMKISSNIVEVRLLYSFIVGEFGTISVTKDCSSGGGSSIGDISNILQPLLGNDTPLTAHSLVPLVDSGDLSLKQYSEIVSYIHQGLTNSEIYEKYAVQQRAVETSCVLHIDVEWTHTEKPFELDLYAHSKNLPLALYRTFKENEIKRIAPNQYRVTDASKLHLLKWADLQVVIRDFSGHSSEMSPVVTYLNP